MLKRIGLARVIACLATAISLSPLANAAVSYTYDDLGRVTSITYDDGKRVTYTYDPVGNRTQHAVEQTVNSPPTAVNDQIAVDIAFGTSTIGYLLANDTDPNGDLLTIQSVTTPSLGTATIGGGGTYVTYAYTGSPALVPTTDVFNYTISDGHGGTHSATATVNIVDTGGGGGGCIPPPGQEFCEL